LYSSPVYCYGELLHDVQLSRIFKDSKTFVDKKMKYSPDAILESYSKLKEKYNGDAPPNDVLKLFVDENFENSTKLERWEPEDWVPNPSVLQKIKDTRYRQWAKDLNLVWKQLSRKMTPEVKLEQDRNSLIYVPNGFIVPGGRFEELYYWDTYWIVNGLMINDMFDTARGVIENLITLLMKIGHVPNGSRVYYEQRSQPPLLILMADSYLRRTKDVVFIKKNIDMFDKEMQFWLNQRSVKVKGKNGVYRMFRYYAPSTGPRPESYLEDLQTAATEGTFERMTQKFISLKSGAESGWDFSTRWLVSRDGNNNGNLSSIQTESIIPVDLNSFLEKCFRLMSGWYSALGNPQKAKEYEILSTKLMTAIEKVLWNEEEGIWLDYNIANQRPRNYFYLSNFVPLWTKSYNRDRNILSERVLKYIDSFNLDRYIGGTPTSMDFSGEQWDFPNAWPPLQAFLIQGLDNLNTYPAFKRAQYFASKWLHSNYKGFSDLGVMFEKYNSLDIGRTGGGGEYTAQSGFGWTNGVVFEFLERWGTVLKYYGD